MLPSRALFFMRSKQIHVQISNAGCCNTGYSYLVMFVLQTHLRGGPKKLDDDCWLDHDQQDSHPLSPNDEWQRGRKIIANFQTCKTFVGLIDCLWWTVPRKVMRLLSVHLYYMQHCCYYKLTFIAFRGQGQTKLMLMNLLSPEKVWFCAFVARTSSLTWHWKKQQIWDPVKSSTKSSS